MPHFFVLKCVQHDVTPFEKCKQMWKLIKDAHPALCMYTIRLYSITPQNFTHWDRTEIWIMTYQERQHYISTYERSHPHRSMCSTEYNGAWAMNFHLQPLKLSNHSFFFFLFLLPLLLLTRWVVLGAWAEMACHAGHHESSGGSARCLLRTEQGEQDRFCIETWAYTHDLDTEI